MAEKKFATPILNQIQKEKEQQQKSISSNQQEKPKCPAGYVYDEELKKCVQTSGKGEFVRTNPVTGEQQTITTTGIRESKKLLADQTLGKELRPKNLVEAEQTTQQKKIEGLGDITPAEIGAVREIQTIQDPIPNQIAIPQRIEQFIENNPVAQAVFAKRIIEKEDFQDVVALTEAMKERGLTPEQITDDPFMQSLLKQEFNESDLEVLRKGQAEISGFTQIIESIPIAGGLVSKFASGLISTPSSRVSDVSKSIETMNEKINRYASDAAANPARAEEYLQLAREAQEQIDNAESRVKLMAMQSPILQANPEKLLELYNRIEKTKETTASVIDRINNTRIKREQGII